MVVPPFIGSIIHHFAIPYSHIGAKRNKTVFKVAFPNVSCYDENAGQGSANTTEEDKWNEEEK